MESKYTDGGSPNFFVLPHCEGDELSWIIIIPVFILHVDVCYDLAESSRENARVDTHFGPPSDSISHHQKVVLSKQGILSTLACLRGMRDHTGVILKLIERGGGGE